jgi:hypothetical protein
MGDRLHSKRKEIFRKAVSISECTSRSVINISPYSHPSPSAVLRTQITTTTSRVRHAYLSPKSYGCKSESTLYRPPSRNFGILVHLFDILASRHEYISHYPTPRPTLYLFKGIYEHEERTSKKSANWGNQSIKTNKKITKTQRRKVFPNPPPLPLPLS